MKSYAFYDLIGVREALEKGEVNELLTKFWNAIDAWTNLQAGSQEPARVVGESHIEAPEIFCASFTDSAVMHTSKDHGPSKFYEIALALKDSIERAAGSCYVVLSYADEIAQPNLPAMGGHSFSRSHVPHYYRLAGSGDSWANMMYADMAVTKTKEWHGTYSVYCVGDSSVPENLEPQDTKVIKGLSGEVNLHAMV